MSIRRTRGWAFIITLAIGTMYLLAVSNGQTPEQRMEHSGQHGFKASELNGLSVYTSGGEEKGRVKDLMIEPDGRVAYAVVSFGGFLGMGDKLFAVPLDAIHFERKDSKINKATVDVTEQTIKERQGFDDNHWPEHADRGFTMNEQNRKPQK